MRIRQFPWDVVNSNSWLVTEGEHGLLVDVVDNNELFKVIENLSDLIVVLTHSHFDHIIGLNKLRELRSDSKVISTEKCSVYLGNIYRNMSSSATAYLKFYDTGKYANMDIEPFTCASSDIKFDRELCCDWYGHRILFKAVYGHSDDGLIFSIDDKYLFSGDTLLSVPTITRFPSGSNKRFREEDIPLLLSFENIEMVYPGHVQEQTLDQMLLVNGAKTK